jgi:hypothetical protein
VHATLVLGAAAVALWQSGSFMVRAEDGLTVGGFGAWSSNLLAFVMPTEGSTFFAPGPIRYANREQYEGYAYLGAGTLILGVTVVIARVMAIPSRGWPKPTWRHVPLVVALLFLAAMAWGPFVTLGSRTIAWYDVAWWGPLRIFRTNGRMIWPFFYAVVVAILWAACRWPPRRALALLVAALCLQLVDLAGMTGDIRDRQAFGFRDPLQNAFWATTAPRFRQLVLVPSNLCVREGFVDYRPFALLAGRYGRGINAGQTARYDVRAAERYCSDLDREFREGQWNVDSLYIVRPDLVPGDARGEAKRCTVVDGFGVCFATNRGG